MLDVAIAYSGDMERCKGWCLTFASWALNEVGMTAATGTELGLFSVASFCFVGMGFVDVFRRTSGSKSTRPDWK